MNAGTQKSNFLCYPHFSFSISSQEERYMLNDEFSYKKIDLYMSVTILKGFKSMKKYSLFNHVKRLVIILLAPTYDDSQGSFFSF